MITRNFSLHEFACPCCGLADPHPALVMGLQHIRDDLGAPIYVNSGSRCASHNAEVGGRRNSMHLRKPEFDDYTLAADISFHRSLIEVFDLVEACRYFASGGIGVYSNPTFLHVDVRGVTGVMERARWGEVSGRSVGHAEALDDYIHRQ